MTPEEWLRLLDQNESNDLTRWHEGDVSFWREVLKLRPDEAVAVSWNKRLPLEIIEQLSAHHDERVRYWITTKRATPADVLARMAMDPSPSVRGGVALHRNTPLPTLKLLISDSVEWVADDARMAYEKRTQSQLEAQPDSHP